MCGIAGRLNHDRTCPVDAGLLRRMIDTLVHRGPDDGGIWTQGPIGLASRRLAIIDLSPQGHMPMVSADGMAWIVFNGEIYNFQELRAELITKGYCFRSRTDTEVVVHLYQAYGVACLGRLRGMFAFAIWDARARRLFLARDRVGKKPLFYYNDARAFRFASEPKAILADPEVPAEPDPLAIHHYLTYQYVPSPLSAFRGMRKLPPAHYLLLEPGKPARIERYWKLRYTPKIHRSEKALCEELRERLREAIRLRMISDVPLGAFLSGGLDSSSIVALMSQMSEQPVKTFSIGFEEERYNELPYARQIAERFSTEHHEFVVKPNAIEILPQLVWHYNEPYADSSALPTYYLSKLAREHVTVVLNGDAGDENFAGYSRHFALSILARVQQLPRWAQKGLVGAAKFIPGSLPPRHILQHAKRFLGRLMDTSPEQEYGRWIGHFSNAEKGRFYTPEFQEATAGEDALEILFQHFAASDTSNWVEAALDVDVNLYLPDDLLVKVDIASMAHSLEARSPLLDHPLMEFVASLPVEMKVRFGVKKYLLKKAMAGILPRDIIHRQKMGFAVPIDRWFRGELKELAIETLLSQRSQSRGYLRPEAIRMLIEEHVSGRANWHHHLWNLLMLELWHQMFIDRTLAPPHDANGGGCSWSPAGTSAAPEISLPVRGDIPSTASLRTTGRRGPRGLSQGPMAGSADMTMIPAQVAP
ncbi:MAG: asparagine synthase (glutamine-hydrolyzing) [Candidatus Omnitrophica bacterium]|nr:asparagine synthase (glutamine-hydrolyzing) [Candidatus Omnitrophota bacterium]